MCSEKDELTAKLNEKQLLCVKSIKFNMWKTEDEHKIEEFFIQYPLKSFRELHSLTLRSITSNTGLSLITDQLPLLSFLTFLDVQFSLYKLKITANELQHMHETIFRRCVALKTLNFTIMDGRDSRKKTHNNPLFTQPITSNIEHLNISELYIEEFDCLLSPSFLPRVKSLAARINYNPNPRQKHFLNDGPVLNSLVKLQVHIEWGITFVYIESILKRTPNLKTLSIDAYPVTFIDCQKWQYFVSTYLAKVVAFRLTSCDHEERDWSKSNQYLGFQTSTYWLKERDGTIQMECKQVWDGEDSDIDSISVTFKTTAFKNCDIKF